VAPKLRIGGQDLGFERIRIGDQDYWVGSVDTRALGIAPEDLRSGAALEYFPVGVGNCLLDALKALEG
jgi:hypothetical protein